MNERITGDTNQITWLVAETFNNWVNRAFLFLGQRVLNIGACITEKKNIARLAFRLCNNHRFVALSLYCFSKKEKRVYWVEMAYYDD
jgi:hypothetical protein